MCRKQISQCQIILAFYVSASTTSNIYNIKITELAKNLLIKCLLLLKMQIICIIILYIIATVTYSYWPMKYLTHFSSDTLFKIPHLI